MKNPIIIEPAGFTAEQGWQGCADYVERCGGLTDEDGEPNMRAAFGADPGCCTCPNCHEYFWSWGKLIECTVCHFQFPPDWWPMYSYGVGDRKTLSGMSNITDKDCERRIIDGINRRMEERMKHSYYRYGFENIVDDPWEAHDKLPWKAIMESNNVQR